MRRRYIPPKIDPRYSLLYFNLLTPAEQAESVKRLLAAGHTEHYVAELTGLGLEVVRRVAAQP